LRFPDSLGLLYSAFTRFTGFAVNSGELELMALAPFGRPVYRDLIMEELIDLKEDGSIRLNPDYFDVLGGLCVTNKRFDRLFGGPPRRPRGAITRREADIAASIQSVTEEAVLRMSRHVRRETGLRYLCLAGDLALNSSVNGRLLREGSFEGVWVQPAAGDAGGALGAAFWVWYGFLGNPRIAETESDSMQGSYLGPSFSSDKVLDFLDVKRCPCIRLEGPEKSRIVAEQIAAGKIVGYMAGRMEFGPNALGARSILGDPRKAETRSAINVKVKSREPFRPLGLTVLEERASDYFELETPSPYMLFSVALKGERGLSPGENREERTKGGLDVGGSDFPAVAGPDCSAVIQSVNRRINPGYYDVIKAFEQITGCPLVVNAGFSMRGEPIVCTPDDAYRCFMRTGMDVLVMEDCILFKEEQPRRR
ncbi:MAG: carbamoyltransferase, partial [Desulfobacteraceae bacterium]